MTAIPSDSAMEQPLDLAPDAQATVTSAPPPLTDRRAQTAKRNSFSWMENARLVLLTAKSAPM